MLWIKMFGHKFTQRFRDFKNLFQDCDVIHLEKERKHLFSKRAKESDFRSGWPKYLNLKAAELPR